MANFVCNTCSEEGPFNAEHTNIGCAPWRKRTSPCSVCLKLETLDSQIAETRAFLEHLETHRAALEPSINNAHDPFTSLLPTELASRIFRFCMNEEDLDSDPGPEPWPLHRVPFVLSAVTKRWQAVARLTTSLWTHVCLRLDPSHTWRLKEEMLNEWLSRSSPHPLTVQLEILYCNSKDLRWWVFCRSIIVTLSKHSARWGDISLKTPDHLLPLFRAYRPGTPHLRSLSIARAFPDEVSDPDNVFDLRTTLPTPQSITLLGCQLRIAHIDWNKVTQADISGITVYESLKMVRSAPALRECILYNIAEVGSIHRLHGEYLLHTALTTLDINISIDQISLFFDRLTTPSLKSLRFECFGQSLDPVTTFLQRSSCPLTSLTILHGACKLNHNHELIEVLEIVPTLETLHVYNVKTFDEFFELLDQQQSRNNNDHQHTFLPSLTDLSVNWRYGAPTFSWSAVHKAIAARVSAEPGREGQGKPMRIELEPYISEDEGGYYIDEESLEGFQRLIHDGVEITIRNMAGHMDVIAYSKKYYADRKA